MPSPQTEATHARARQIWPVPQLVPSAAVAQADRLSPPQAARAATRTTNAHVRMSDASYLPTDDVSTPSSYRLSRKNRFSGSLVRRRSRRGPNKPVDVRRDLEGT